MKREIKVDIIYYHQSPDWMFESGLYSDVYHLRLLTQTVESGAGFIKALGRAVARSEMIITVGGFESGVRYLPAILAKSIGLECVDADYKVLGVPAPANPVMLPRGSLPFLNDEKQVAGGLLESGGQAIAMLTGDRSDRHALAESLVYPYLLERYNMITHTNSTIQEQDDTVNKSEIINNTDNDRGADRVPGVLTAGQGALPQAESGKGLAGPEDLTAPGVTLAAKSAVKTADVMREPAALRIPVEPVLADISERLAELRKTLKMRESVFENYKDTSIEAMEKTDKTIAPAEGAVINQDASGWPDADDTAGAAEGVTEGVTNGAAEISSQEKQAMPVPFPVLGESEVYNGETAVGNHDSLLTAENGGKEPFAVPDMVEKTGLESQKSDSGALPDDGAVDKDNQLAELCGIEPGQEISDEEEHIPQDKQKRFKPVVLIIILIAAVAIAVGGYFFYENIFLPWQADTAYTEIISMYGTDASAPVELGVLPKFGRLIDMNDDVAGWITMPGTGINYPIVTAVSRDEGFYQNHLFNETVNRYGTPYTEQAMENDSYHRNLTIHAKNTGDGRMFSGLGTYMELDFYKTAPIITMDTIYLENEWKIFSIFKASVLDPVDFEVTSFFDDAEYLAYLSVLAARSQLITTVDLNADDEIITLVAHGDEGLTIVAARKVRAGEISTVDVDGARINPDPAEPGEEVASILDNATTSTDDEGSSDPDSSLDAVPAMADPEAISSLHESSADESAQNSKAVSSKGASSKGSSSKPASSAGVSSSKPTSSTGGGTGGSGAISNEASSPPVAQIPKEPAPNTGIMLSVKNQSTGKVITEDSVYIISRILEAEMGSGFHIEALKAQSVAAYSWLLCNGAASGKNPSVPMKEPGARALEAAKATVGQKAVYKGSVAQTYYYATSAGQTANSSDIWTAQLPYLVSVDSSVDKNTAKFQTVVTYTASEVAGWVKSQYGFDISGKPKSDWFKVTYDENGLYAKTVTIGGQKTVKGPELRDRLFISSRVGSSRVLRSSAYTISYNAIGDSFTFTVKGYGHGVGMSQNGANQYANSGWGYIQILKHYYPGITVE